jgi:hypothetical protein
VAEQAPAGIVQDPGDTEGTGLNSEVSVQLGPEQTHDAFHGRRSSWVAVAIIIIGFIVGGAAMIPHPTWWLIWVGVGIVAVGAIIATFTRIFDDWY